MEAYVQKPARRRRSRQKQRRPMLKTETAIYILHNANTFALQGIRRLKMKLITGTRRETVFDFFPSIVLPVEHVL